MKAAAGLHDVGRRGDAHDPQPDDFMARRAVAAGLLEASYQSSIINLAHDECRVG